MATVEAALPPGTVAWIGPAHVLDAIVPHARRSADAVLPVESATFDAGALAAAIAGARAVVDARGDVWAAAAVLRAAPPTAAIMALLLPPHSLDSARITGWARTATIEERGRRVAALAIGAAAAASGGDAVGGACLAVAAADVAVTRAVLGDDGVVMVDRLQSGWSPLPRTPDTPWLLQPPPVAPGPRWRLAITRPGQIGSLSPRRYEPEPLRPGELRLQVRAAALQFKDVMFALDLLPGVPGEIGTDVVGTIVEMHPATRAAFPDLAVGGRVAACVLAPHGALASHPVAGALFTCAAPPTTARLIGPA
jgi:hypothetical protein